MSHIYEYRSIRIVRAAWPRVAEAVRDADAFVVGLWRGEIGWYTDEGAILSAHDADLEMLGKLDGLSGVLESTLERLEATVRPVAPEALSGDGVWAHRWFHIAPGDRDEFVRLSQEAWPQFESAHDGTSVAGLFSSLDDPSRLLLVTRYASLAMWERSRPYNPDPAPGTDDARARFMRRAELTERTIVRLGRLITPS